ncbi:hypothetical protein FQN54_004955 [Arachnomyces sp. PD_36]|nr:hypothetical protein FQN54_004955 [Arachnomyces sp. PD_36]
MQFKNIIIVATAAFVGFANAAPAYDPWTEIPDVLTDEGRVCWVNCMQGHGDHPKVCPHPYETKYDPIFWIVRPFCHYCCTKKTNTQQRPTDEVKDTAILNAGVIETDFKTVPSMGREIVMQVDYHSTVLLSLLLLPVLKAKTATGVVPKLTIVNSARASFSELPNRDGRPFLQSFDSTNATPIDGNERYNDSMLVCQFFLSRLAEAASPDLIINMLSQA